MKIICSFSSKQLNKSNLGQIFLQITIGNYRKRFGTGIYIAANQWNEKTHRINRKHTNADALNIRLDEMMLPFEKWRSDMLKDGKRIDNFSFQEFIGEKTPEGVPSFNAFFRKIMDGDKNIKYSTHRDQSQTIRLLDMFGIVPMNQVSKKFILEFDEFMTNQGLNPNTRAKHHKTLKKYLRRAIDYEYLRFDLHLHPYYRFKAPRQVVNRDFLTPRELEIFEQCEPVTPGRQDTKDLFLWSCYTGMRWSDTQRFQSDWISELKLHYVPVKTEKNTGVVVVPIAELFEGKALKLLERNNGHLPKQSIQVVNENLKTLLMMSEINKKMSFHSSRHTFLTLMAFYTGNLFKVMRWGGIKKPDIAMRYIHLANELS